MSTGKFNAGQNGLGVKFFAENYDNAVTWGDKLNGVGNSRIIEVRIPNKTANNTEIFYRWEKLDGIGPARAAPVEEINNIKLKILSKKDKDDDDNNKGAGGTGGNAGGTNPEMGFDFNGCYATVDPTATMGIPIRQYVIGVSNNGTPLIVGSTLLGAKRIYESKSNLSGFEGSVPTFMTPLLSEPLPSVVLPRFNTPKVKIPIPEF